MLPLNLLVVECTPHLSWYDTFAGVDGVVVHQAEWDDISGTWQPDDHPWVP